MFKHINDCWDTIDKCMSKDELEDLFEEFPRWSGDWYIENEYNYCTVVNSYFDDLEETWVEDRRDTDIKYDPDCMSDEDLLD